MAHKRIRKFNYKIKKHRRTDLLKTNKKYKFYRKYFKINNKKR